MTYISRDSEDPLYAQAELSNRLAMMVGGREAELLVKGSVSSGASDDLKRASELAINMVGSLGFSTTFGLLSVAGVPKDLLGPDIQAALLEEARTMLEQAQAQCQQMLSSRRGQLDALAQALLQREVLSGDELRGLLAGRQAPRVQEALPGSEALRRGRRGLFAGAQCIGPSRRRLLDAEPGRCALAGLARPPNRIRKGTPP